LQAVFNEAWKQAKEQQIKQTEPQQKQAAIDEETQHEQPYSI
jgi:hypothetical protein